MSAPRDAKIDTEGVLPFGLGEGSAIRGRLARIDTTASSILARHNYPPLVAQLGAEAMALTAALASSLDYEGVFSLQANGKGAVKMVFVDATSKGAMRCYLRHDESGEFALEEDSFAPILQLMGDGDEDGYLAFTIEQDDKGRHQGIVAIEKPSLAEVAQDYFKNSEQIETALLIASKHDGNNKWRAGALLLQSVADIGGKASNKDTKEMWQTACALMATLRQDELLSQDLSPEDLLYRLFNELGVTVWKWRDFTDECRCSPERVMRMLDGLDDEELQSLADADNAITITCEFCKSEHSVSL